MKKYKKAFVTILILEVIICYLLAILKTGSLVIPFQDLSIYFFLGIILVPSFFIAFIVIVLFYKEGFEHKVLFYCHLLVFSSFLLLNAYLAIKNQYLSGSPGNTDIEEEPEKAWIVLKNNMKNSDIHLKSFWMEAETEHNPRTFYLTYFYGNDSQNEHYSRIIRMNDAYIVKESGIAKDNPKIDSFKKLIPEEIRSWVEE